MISMAEKSHFLILFYSAFLVFSAVNKSSVNGGRLQVQNQNLEMNTFIHASSSTKKDLVRKRDLGEHGEGIHLPLKSGNNGNFLVTIGFGTPATDFTLLFDTGSDLTWINCQSNSKIPTFNPSSSSTFSAAVNCKNSNCNYTGKYHDGTSFSGYIVKDTLTLVFDPIPGFIFACAQQIDGEFEGASGLLGLGKGSFSLIAQTDVTLFSTFCYCLPAASSSPGYLVLGVQAFESCQPETDKIIPIEEASGQNGLTGYYISLAGISIGGKRLGISPVRAIIDSGTVISRLPSSLYSALRLEFEAIMSGFSRVDSSEPELLDTCYNLGMSISGWAPPAIVLHFGGGKDVVLDSSAATTTGKSDSEVCLAFAGNKDDNDLVIIGNQQHRNRDLFFDINNKGLYFSSHRCSNI